MNGDFLLLESLKNLRMSELNRTYDEVCDHIYECIETYFETNFSDIDNADKLYEEVQSAFNDSVFTDHFSEDYIGGWDMFNIVCYIMNHYQDEYGQTYSIYNKQTKDIINLFAFLCAEQYIYRFLDEKKQKQQ